MMLSFSFQMFIVDTYSPLALVRVIVPMKLVIERDAGYRDRLNVNKQWMEKDTDYCTPTSCNILRGKFAKLFYNIKIILFW